MKCPPFLLLCQRFLFIFFQSFPQNRWVLASAKARNYDCVASVLLLELKPRGSWLQDDAFLFMVRLITVFVVRKEIPQSQIVMDCGGLHFPV